MKSLDTLLAEVVGKMKSATRRRFAAETKGEKISQESLVNIAESMLAEDGAEARESSRGIRRHNGGSHRPSGSESRESAMQAADAVMFGALEASRPTSKGLSDLVEVNGRYEKKGPAGDQLSESQKADREFCRLLGMSESDSLKVALSNAIRG